MRHARKIQRRFLPKVLVVAALAAVILVGSMITVMANTMEITVVDGEQEYAFSHLGANPAEIVSRAEQEGMQPLSDIDTYTFDAAAGKLCVQRMVRVQITADGKTSNYTVPKGTTLQSVLEAQHYALQPGDAVTPDVTTVLEENVYARVVRVVQVYVRADGKRQRLALSEENTVGDALAAAGVTLHSGDAVSPAEDTFLSRNMEITVSRKVTVTVLADGETRTETVVASDYADAVQGMGITLHAQDQLYRVTYPEQPETEEITDSDADAQPQEQRTLVNRRAPVQTGETVRVVRIRTEVYTEDVVLEHDTRYTYNEEWYEDESETHVEGRDGAATLTMEITYADGEETGRREVGRVTHSLPVTAEVEQGTMPRYPFPSSGRGTFIDGSGTPVDYEFKLTGSCTAYYAPPGAITSIGATPQVGYVAVDPTIIPYGSLLYITSPFGTWDYGYCYAMDTGGAAMCGDIVADLYYNTYEDCCAFGRRDMDVYIIRSGW